MSLRSNSSSESSQSGFTLVELLVAIGIIAIMMAMILPAFRGFGRSASMNGSVAQLRTTLSLARQMAITKRSLVYVVFATSNTASAVPSEAWRANRSYAVLLGTNYIKEWIAFPPGVVLSPDAAGFPGTSGHGDNVLRIGGQMTNSFPYSTSSTRAPFRRIQFDANGAATGVEVYLTEGTVETNGDISVRPNGLKFGIEVKALTGQVRVRDYNP